MKKSLLILFYLSVQNSPQFFYSVNISIEYACDDPLVSPPAFSGMIPDTTPTHVKHNPPLCVGFGCHNLTFLDLLLLECTETSDNCNTFKVP